MDNAPAELDRTETSRKFKPSSSGVHYQQLLKRFHTELAAQTYLEIGTACGKTLELATCASIAVDPWFRLYSAARVIGDKPSCLLFQMLSDDFFARYNAQLLFGRPVDLAFLGGSHQCAFLLRDFINTERCCSRSSVILLHNCLPAEMPITSRIRGSEQFFLPHQQYCWTGDVWRAALALKLYRPDLHIAAYDATPTGLVAVTNLDPGSTLLADYYSEIVDTMVDWTLDLNYFDEMKVESTSTIGTAENMRLRFQR